MKITRSVLLVIGVTVVILLFLAALTAVREYQDVIAPDAQQVLVVHPGESVGQSFIARHAGLQGIEIFIDGKPSQVINDIGLSVQATDQPGEPIVRHVDNAGGASVGTGWQRFAFAPIGDSRNQRFIALITVRQDSNGDIALRSAPGDTYHDGALYLVGRPQDAQLAIRLSYNPWYIALDLIAWAVQAALVCTLAAILFVLPGLALQTYLLPLPGEAWRTKLGIAAGLSLCLYPLLLVWANALGFRQGVGALLLPVGLAVAALGWRIWRVQTPLLFVNGIKSWWQGSARTPDLVWIAVVAVVAFVRLFLLRSLDAPMWGDSVQHSMIGQLIADNGGLFSSWLPYVPYDSLTVHPGFHVTIAVLMWATGSASLAATSLAGQLVNILAILALVPLAQRITKSEWTGVGVVIVAGLLAPLPNGYIIWGRYPQLMGQAIVPVAIWLVWRMLDGEDHPDWHSVLFAAIVFAGTFLAYYRMPHYVVIFTLVLLLLDLMRRQLRRRAFVALLISVLITVLFVLPWLLRLRGSALGEGVDAVTVQSSSLDTIVSDYRGLVGMAEPLLGGGLIIATLAVIVVAFVTRHKRAIVITLWVIGLLCLPATRLVRLPGLNNLWVFAVLISLYIPMGLLLGAGIDVLLTRARKSHRMTYTIILVLVIAVALLGARDRLGAYDPRYRILAPADVRAMAWIRENIPQDARIAVDGFLVYDGRSAVGSDGGWWIPLLTSRQTTMPPQYPLLAEHAINPGYNDMVVDFTTQVRKVGISSREGLAVLCRHGISYVYVGEEQGSIAIPPQTPMLPIGDMLASNAFTALYRQDRVAVFQFDRLLCK